MKKEKQDKKEEVTFMTRMDYGVTPIRDTLFVGCEAQGGSSPTSSGFVEGVIFGAIIGSALNN